MTWLLILTPFIFSLLNRVRGGLLKVKGISAFIAAGFLSAFIFAVTLNHWAASAFFVAYIAGESFGWGKWLVVLPRTLTQEEYNTSPWIARDDGKNNGIHQLANALFAEHKNYYKYAITALMFRGTLWMLPVFFALGVTNAIPVWSIALAGILGGAFPYCYLLGVKLYPTHYWSTGEWIFGFLFGLVLAPLLYIGG